jgi:cytochrome c oxidase subunit III
MEIGVADVIVEETQKPGPRRGLTGGSPPSSGGGGGGGGDDGDDRHLDRQRQEGSTEVPDKARIVTAFLLLVVLMTFGGLIGAYIVISTNSAAEWRPFALPIQLWVSTAIMIISSGTYVAAKSFIDRGDDLWARRWLIATTALGAAFISSQLLAWLVLVERGLYMRGNPFAGFFYILTAVHAVHLLGGIVALGALLLYSWNPALTDMEFTYRKNLARSVGYYWHFMGALWIALFVLLGFWK